jgi:hypothetical protein
MYRTLFVNNVKLFGEFFLKVLAINLFSASASA